jgi:hypothetical protein
MQPQMQSPDALQDFVTQLFVPDFFSNTMSDHCEEVYYKEAVMDVDRDEEDDDDDDDGSDFDDSNVEVNCFLTTSKAPSSEASTVPSSPRTPPMPWVATFQFVDGSSKKPQFDRFTRTSSAIQDQVENMRMALRMKRQEAERAKKAAGGVAFCQAVEDKGDELRSSVRGDASCSSMKMLTAPLSDLHNIRLRLKSLLSCFEEEVNSDHCSAKMLEHCLTLPEPVARPTSLCPVEPNIAKTMQIDESATSGYSAIGAADISAADVEAELRTLRSC